MVLWLSICMLRLLTVISESVHVRALLNVTDYGWFRFSVFSGYMFLSFVPRLPLVPSCLQQKTLLVHCRLLLPEYLFNTHKRP